MFEPVNLRMIVIHKVPIVLCLTLMQQKLEQFGPLAEPAAEGHKKDGSRTIFATFQHSESAVTCTNSYKGMWGHPVFFNGDVFLPEGHAVYGDLIVSELEQVTGCSELEFLPKKWRHEYQTKCGRIYCCFHYVVF